MAYSVDSNGNGHEDGTVNANGDSWYYGRWWPPYETPAGGWNNGTDQLGPRYQFNGLPVWHDVHYFNKLTGGKFQGSDIDHIDTSKDQPHLGGPNAKYRIEHGPNGTVLVPVDGGAPIPYNPDPNLYNVTSDNPNFTGVTYGSGGRSSATGGSSSGTSRLTPELAASSSGGGGRSTANVMSGATGRTGGGKSKSSVVVAGPSGSSGIPSEATPATTQTASLTPTSGSTVTTESSSSDAGGTKITVPLGPPPNGTDHPWASGYSGASWDQYEQQLRAWIDKIKSTPLDMDKMKAAYQAYQDALQPLIDMERAPMDAALREAFNAAYLKADNLAREALPGMRIDPGDGTTLEIIPGDFWATFGYPDHKTVSFDEFYAKVQASLPIGVVSASSEVLGTAWAPDGLPAGFHTSGPVFDSIDDKLKRGYQEYVQRFNAAKAAGQIPANTNQEPQSFEDMMSSPQFFWYMDLPDGKIVALERDVPYLQYADGTLRQAVTGGSFAPWGGTTDELPVGVKLYENPAYLAFVDHPAGAGSANPDVQSFGLAGGGGTGSTGGGTSGGTGSTTGGGGGGTGSTTGGGGGSTGSTDGGSSTGGTGGSGGTSGGTGSGGGSGGNSGGGSGNLKTYWITRMPPGVGLEQLKAKIEAAGGTYELREAQTVPPQNFVLAKFGGGSLGTQAFEQNLTHMQANWVKLGDDANIRVPLDASADPAGTKTFWMTEMPAGYNLDSLKAKVASLGGNLQIVPSKTFPPQDFIVIKYGGTDLPAFQQSASSAGIVIKLLDDPSQVKFVASAGVTGIGTGNLNTDQSNTILGAGPGAARDIELPTGITGPTTTGTSTGTSTSGGDSPTTTGYIRSWTITNLPASLRASLAEDAYHMRPTGRSDSEYDQLSPDGLIRKIGDASGNVEVYFDTRTPPNTEVRIYIIHQTGTEQGLADFEKVMADMGLGFRPKTPEDEKDRSALYDIVANQKTPAPFSGDPKLLIYPDQAIGVTDPTKPSIGANTDTGTTAKTSSSDPLTPSHSPKTKKEKLTAALSDTTTPDLPGVGSKSTTPDAPFGSLVADDTPSGRPPAGF